MKYGHHAWNMVLGKLNDAKWNFVWYNCQNVDAIDVYVKLCFLHNSLPITNYQYFMVYLEIQNGFLFVRFYAFLVVGLLSMVNRHSLSHWILNAISKCSYIDFIIAKQCPMIIFIYLFLSFRSIILNSYLFSIVALKIYQYNWKYFSLQLRFKCPLKLSTEWFCVIKILSF